MTRSKPFIIGVTGLTGGGKTTVTRLLEARGGFAVVADALAHEAIKRGQPAYDEILNIFGTDILDGGGEIDRRKLGKQVFDGGEGLRILEGIIHPRVISETRERIRRSVTDGGPYAFAVIDAPLLIEAGMHTHCHSVWLVTAPEALRKSRIIRRDGLTPQEAAKRMASRRGEEALLPYAHVVIRNDGTTDSLHARVGDALRSMPYT
jgi:dephospho-CoA kinase